MRLCLRHRVKCLCLIIGFLCPAITRAAEPQPWLQYADVAEAGWSAEKLTAAREYSRKLGSGAVFVAYRGHVLGAWGAVERRFRCHSVRKSLVSALYGIHVGEGAIDIQKTLRDLGIDDREPLTAEEKSARIVDLLSARSGVYHPAAKEPPDMTANRPTRGSHAPGTHWWYNNWDFNTLGVIFEQETRKELIDEFRIRLAIPLGMDDFRPQDAYKQLEPGKSIHPAHDFRLSARDLARVGQLYLQKGKWQGKQVISESWIAESTRFISKTDAFMGYGYMWWIGETKPTDPKSRTPHLDRYSGFAARGAGGHLLLVIPEAELVFVHRSDTDHDLEIGSRNIHKIIDMILAAKEGNAVEHPRLVPVEPVRFPNARTAPPEHVAVQVDPKHYAGLEGNFKLDPDWQLRVFIYENRLFADAKGRGEAELFPLSPTSFFLRADDATIQFVLDDAGKAQAIDIVHQGETSRVPRIGS